MITIKYSPEGRAIADHEAEEFVRELIRDNKETKKLVDEATGDDAIVNLEVSDNQFGKFIGHVESIVDMTII